MFVGKLNLLDSRLEAFILMQLVDLARTFTRNGDLELQLAFHSHYEEKKALLTVSQFWRDWKPAQREAGMKSDVYLRALGSAWYSGRRETEGFLESATESPLSRLGIELFALCEDLRLELICRRIRPGTSAVFEERADVYKGYFTHKFKTHLARHEFADALFVSVYLWFKGTDVQALYSEAGSRIGETSAESAAPTKHVEELLRLVQPLLEEAETAETTAENARLCLQMLELLEYRLERDAAVAYFSAQPGSGTDAPLRRGERPAGKKAKRLANDDAERLSPRQDKDRSSERQSMWHRETRSTAGEALRQSVERGTRTARFSGAAARPGDDTSEEAMTAARGRSAASERKSEPPPDSSAPFIPSGASAGSGDGSSGLRAVAELQAPRRPTPAEEEAYREAIRAVEPLTRQLTRTVRLTLERKRVAPRSDLLYGRLGRRQLLRYVTDEAPRLFTKKQNPAPELDAAFSLLVDCSASMYDKMEETKLGISLVHETLRTLRIPHEVTGFWEDAERVTAEEAPNVFHTVIDFGSSSAPRSGAALLQLEPQQDNRDGFAIRHAARRLLRRPEKQRVLLVFSDGEPSAAEYQEDGILDTYEAVLECRRLGIDVISVFLASGEVHETQRTTMRNIYGRHGIVIPHAADLPEYLAPLLRKLLLRSGG
ncbi:cobaltochelatase CobT-related protein [Paenibacillus chitinolyticus]|uniref:vWA domain-containing protein n=1 Tax=Paenibacillus chitinolyticus TaxID=79263 RepID=UPI003CFCA2EC